MLCWHRVRMFWLRKHIVGFAVVACVAAVGLKLAVLSEADLIGETQAIAGSFEDSVAAYERGDYATALQLLRPLAERGDAAAQLNLGIIYQKGRGVPQNYAAALLWFGKAANQGMAVAQYNLGSMYHGG